jgi:beta-galactosidase GanA
MIKRIFTVDGKPFFPLGGQARNSSGYNDAESETAFRAVELIGGNTLEIPVYWDQVEPQEGAFDFASVDALLASARRHGLKLVLLWFGTWKNGDMDYAPAWVKTNPARFHRVISPSGKDCWVLSSHCAANFEADHRAFVALCDHLKAVDGVEGTVIAIQIENEPGILGSDRDYGPDGQADFERPVPAELIAAMRTAGRGQAFDLWRAAGQRASGSWVELFGAAAGELMTAWSIATYIDRLAEAGKAILDVPMYINVWLGEGGWKLPGETYPSGGAVGRVLDIYKWCAPHVDLIAPDIYVADSRGYEAICALYARGDNPLFVPESGPGGANAWNIFRALADYDVLSPLITYR